MGAVTKEIICAIAVPELKTAAFLKKSDLFIRSETSWYKLALYRILAVFTTSHKEE
jgi:hypothetical protein